MGGPHRRRRDMTEAEKIEARRHARHVAYRRASGVPDMCSPEETARALAKVRRMAYRHGMSTAQIVETAGVSSTTVKDCLAGHRVPYRPIKHLHRTVYDGIMRAPILPSDGRRRMPVDGARRRLQALTVQGFTLKAISEFLDYANYQRVWQIQYRDNSFIYWDSLQKIIEVYDKHHAEDPADYGVPVGSIKRSISAGRRNGWAPFWAWDDDTIDDPKAIPEWTGACGTEEGYRIHIRESLEGRHLPPCGPCKEVAEVVAPGHLGAAGEVPFSFNHERFAEALDERGINPRQLAIKLGRDPREADRLYRWRMGNRSPKNRGEVHRICAALELEPGELMRDLEPGEGGKRLIGQPGGFNPFVFRAVIDARGLTQREAGAMCDVSGTTIAKWVRGEFSPGSKAIIKPLADELGLDVEIFYS